MVVTCTFVHEVMSTLVHQHFLCYPKKFKAFFLTEDRAMQNAKKFKAITGKMFISIQDISSVKYRVYNKTCTRTRTVITGVYKNLCIRPLVKSPEKYHSSRPVNNNVLWFYCLDDDVLNAPYCCIWISVHVSDYTTFRPHA